MPEQRRLDLEVDYGQYYEALASLPHPGESLVRFRYGIGIPREQSLSDISNRLNCPIGRARHLLHVARDTLLSRHGISRRDLQDLCRWERWIYNQSPLVRMSQPPETIELISSVHRLLNELTLERRSLLELSPRQFEEFIAEIWSRLGYVVELTIRTRDGGRDIVAVRQAEIDLRILIECKRFNPSRKVGVGLVRALYGVKVHEAATKAILATTSSFSRDALEFCDQHRWELEPRDYDGIQKWIGLLAASRQRTTSGLWVPNNCAV